jgi:hypothetical protein
MQFYNVDYVAVSGSITASVSSTAYKTTYNLVGDRHE